jgi:hypothetical protein
MKPAISTAILMASALILGLGPGIYEHLFRIPKMLSSPAAMAFDFSHSSGQAQIFWIPLHLLILFSLSFSLYLNWRNPGRKAFVLWALILYLYVDLISIWFTRELLALAQLTDGPEFHSRASLWLILSWHRPLLLLVCQILLFKAITKPALKSVAYESVH